MFGGSLISLHNYEGTHAHTHTPTHTHTHTHTHAAHWQDSHVRSPAVSPADEHPAESSQTTKYKNPLYRNPSVFSPLSVSLSTAVSPFIPVSIHSSIPPPPFFLSFSLCFKIQCQWATGILAFFIHTTGGHGAQSLDDVRLHVFTLEGVPLHLPQPFNSDVRNSVTGRVKVLGY